MIVVGIVGSFDVELGELVGIGFVEVVDFFVGVV